MSLADSVVRPIFNKREEGNIVIKPPKNENQHEQRKLSHRQPIRVNDFSKGNWKKDRVPNDRDDSMRAPVGVQEGSAGTEAKMQPKGTGNDGRGKEGFSKLLV